MQANDLKWLEQEIKVLIVDELRLEDIEPDEIDSDMPLFSGGLGLSSVNALEFDAALRRHFADRIGQAGDDGVRRVATVDLFRYSTVRLLAEHLGDGLSPEANAPAAQDFGARRRAALLQKTNHRGGGRHESEDA